MAKTKKISTEELEAINSTINAMRDGQMRYGALSLQIASINDQLAATRQSLSELEQKMAEQRQEMQEKYGDVNIDLKTGEVTEQITEAVAE